MGMITITFNGSFGQKTRTFSAMEHGHAAAVSEAISYLASGPMQEAIVNDHRCHADGLEPSKGFAAVPGIVKKAETA